MKRRRFQKRTGWLVLGAALAGGVLFGRAWASSVSDPWPTSPVLIRLFRLSGPRTAQYLDVQDLQENAHLTSQQLDGIRGLTDLERQSARLGNNVTDRLQARLVNTQIAALREQKDTQARKLLGAQYPAFRAWLRQWWGREVARSRGSVQARQLVVPASKVPPEMQNN